MPRMKAYATFDLYLAGQAPANRALLRALRAFVRKAAPGLEESVKWGNGCWLSAGSPVAYVYSYKDHVQFGFLRGASLRDPRRLLQGKGRYVRHAKVRRAGDIDRVALGALLAQAVALGGITKEERTGGRGKGKAARGAAAPKPRGRKPGRGAAGTPVRTRT